MERLRPIGRFHCDDPSGAVGDRDVVDAELLLPVFEESPHPVLVAAHVVRGVEEDVVRIVAETTLGMFAGAPAIEIGDVATFEMDTVG